MLANLTNLKSSIKHGKVKMYVSGFDGSENRLSDMGI